MNNPNKSVEGDLIFSIFRRPLHQGMSRKKLVQIFVQETNLFKSYAELKVKLKNLIKQNLISKYIFNRDAYYMISDKTIGYLNEHGYLDLAEARTIRRNELIKKTIDFNAEGQVVFSRKNYNAYLKILQILAKEFSKKYLPLNVIEENIGKMYLNASSDELEHDIDLLVFKGINGEI